jgi:hypothetical protein
MRFGAVLLGLSALLAAADDLPPAYAESGRSGGGAPTQTVKGPLNTLKDIGDAMRACWVWPPAEDISTGMELTVMLSFRSNGEIFGGRITHQSANVSEKERALYYTALADAIRRCSPLPVSDGLGRAIAGRLFTFRFTDNRKQRKA